MVQQVLQGTELQEAGLHSERMGLSLAVVHCGKEEAHCPQ